MSDEEAMSDAETARYPSLARHLEQIPDLVTEAFATRGTRPISSDGAGARRPPSSVCLADLDRMLALDPRNTEDGIGVLAAFVRAVIGELDEDGKPYEWPADSVSAACAWLLGKVDYIADKPILGEWADDVAKLWRILRGICRRADPKPWPCMTPGCGGRLAVDDRGLLRCEYDHDWGSLGSWRNHGQVRADVAAEQFGIDYPTLRQWRSRGRIAGEMRDGRLYVWPWEVICCRWPELAALAA